MNALIIARKEIHQAIRNRWVLASTLLLAGLALSLALALVLGFWGSWRALGAKAAPFLRNE